MKTQKLIALTALLALASGALNAQELGAVTPNVEAGKWAIGGTWSYGEMKLTDTGCSGSGCDYKVKANHVYVQADWGFTKTWAGYARLGVADLKDDTAGSGSKLNLAPFLGVGVNGAVYSSGAFSTGPAIQLNYFFEESKTNGGFKYTAKSHWNGSVGWGFEGKWDAVTFYGGPQYYTEEFKPTVSGYGITVSGDTQKSKGNLGAYAGARFTPAPNWRINFEANYRGGVGVGLGFAYKF